MVRLAVIQTPGTRLSEWRSTLAGLLARIEEAAAGGAELVVMPECAWPAYFLESTSAFAEARRQGMPSGMEFVAQLRRLSRDRRLVICAGFVDERHGELFNSACLIDSNGELRGVYDKCFLWDFDRRWFRPGGRLTPLDTRLGRVGVMICADNRMPEIPATLAQRGAQLILQPTAWINGGTAAQPWSLQADFLVSARAFEFGLPIASASKWGTEGNTLFVGSSLICDAGGHKLVQASGAETVVLYADVKLPPRGHVRVSPAEAEALRASASQSIPVIEAEAELRAVDMAGAKGLAIRVGGQESRVPGPLPDALNIGGAVIGTLVAADAERFAPSRLLALRGAHGIAVFGPAFEPVLRARAAENRIYVAHVQPEGVKIYDPRGWLVPPASDGAFRLPLAVACEKVIAWQTNVLQDRRPDLYQLCDAGREAAMSACGGA